MPCGPELSVATHITREYLQEINVLLDAFSKANERVGLSGFATYKIYESEVSETDSLMFYNSLCLCYYLLKSRAYITL